MVTQTDRLIEALSDYQPHSSFELVSRVYNAPGPSLARLAARVYDAKQKGFRIKSWKDEIDSTKHWYQLLKEVEPVETKPIQLLPASWFKDPVEQPSLFESTY